MSEQKKEVIKTKVGGQALIEGVMMLGPKKGCMAVRQPDREIYTEVWDRKTPKWYNKAPFIRGCINFVSQLGDGYKYLNKSGEVSGMFDEEEDEKDKKKKEKDKFEQQIEELTDRLKRNMVEFDNFRKRTEKEKSSMYIIGAKDIVEKMLPVVDNFERGLAQAPEGDSFADGMKMIYKQLITTLDELGVKPIEAVGKEFDPNFHNAVMHVEDETLGENVVAEELQKGYMYRDTVVRHSMVKVAN